jgi:peptidoglycan-associated lipoprotein
VGIDPALHLQLNGDMKSLLPILLLSMCCACGPRRVVVVPQGGGEIKIVDPAPLPPNPVNASTTASTSQETAEEPASPVVAKPKRSAEAVIAELNGQLRDAFFPYDRSEVTPEALSALRADAALLLPILTEFPSVRVVVEGHCDERGSAEYNIGLGDRRSARARAVLVDYGIPAARIQTISYGKEMLQCTQPAESCWWKNRRVHMRLSPEPDSITP